MVIRPLLPASAVRLFQVRLGKSSTLHFFRYRKFGKYCNLFPLQSSSSSRPLLRFLLYLLAFKFCALENASSFSAKNRSRAPYVGGAEKWRDLQWTFGQLRYLDEHPSPRSYMTGIGFGECLNAISGVILLNILRVPDEVIDKVQEETKNRADRKPPGAGGRGRGRGREDGTSGRPAKGIGRGVDDGIAKGVGGGRGRGGPGGRTGGGRGR